MTKYTGVEKAEVLSPAQHKVAQDTLRSMGKTSAKELTEDERKRLGNNLDKTQ
jgi:hypothetical protein